MRGRIAEICGSGVDGVDISVVSRGNPLRYPCRPMRVLLVTPPMVQLNTPYPATAYLTGFLRQHAAALDLEVTQADPALALFLRLFSRPGLARVRDVIAALKPAARRATGPSVAAFLDKADDYV